MKQKLFSFLICCTFFFVLLNCTDSNNTSENANTKIVENRNDKCQPSFSCEKVHIKDTVDITQKQPTCKNIVVEYDVYPCANEISVVNIKWYVYKEVHDSCFVTDWLDKIEELRLKDPNGFELTYLLNYTSSLVVNA